MESFFWSWEISSEIWKSRWSWKNLTEVRKSCWSWKVLTEVGKLSLKLKSVTELEKLIIKSYVGYTMIHRPWSYVKNNTRGTHFWCRKVLKEFIIKCWICFENTLLVQNITSNLHQKCSFEQFKMQIQHVIMNSFKHFSAPKMGISRILRKVALSKTGRSNRRVRMDGSKVSKWTIHKYLRVKL